MSKRFSVVQAKEVPGRDKPIWMKHGVAFEGPKGLSIKLESLPLPNKDGEVWLKLFEDDGSQGAGGNGGGRSNGGSSGGSSNRGREDLDDSIPF
ncbi:hypothetical protein UFOVP847_49 [uncultured Caudovirales phage]|uniref:Uncharacterized protein n=1 Tax=uncultured Caudovirales phage TaxID=2100421 RepID=A0A6J5P5H3_9CAUD|nr:hypothetical protein UFOVP847_49 [uncultured Caudovirales phage]